MGNNKKEVLTKKVKDFEEELSKLFEDPKFVKKFDGYRKKLEDMVDCEVRVEILATSKFKKELDELGFSDTDNYEDEMSDNEYWNRYSTTIRELNEYYIDVENRNIFYSYDIEQGTPFFLEARIKTIEKLNPFDEEYDDDDYINLHINSYGGDAYGMLGTIDVIRLSKYPIKGIAKGQVMSAGAYILIGCHHRVMSKKSIMMLHDLNTFLGGTYKDISSEYNHIQALQGIVYQFLEEKSNKDKDWWEKKLQRNLYLTANEAKELGLIDEII
jgi:ATP-dependent Clp protease, protease subunit